MDETPAGVVIRDVIAGSPAERAGLREGDLIEEVGGSAASSALEVAERVFRTGVGAELPIRFLRAGASLTATAELAPAPAGGPAGILRMRFLGRRAPAIEAVRPTVGAVPTLARLRGNVVVLDFWATWCRPCRAAMQQFADWHRRYRDRGLHVIGLTDEESELVSQFSAAARVPYALATDPEARTSSRYGVSAIPTMFIIDRAGVVRHISVGMDDEEARSAEALIQTLLAERTN